ncbi:MAG: hypothetical protein IJT84_00915 [Clostridia bacterium]|nr:hypothetical protein [Clostridia bacterium]
MKGFLKSKVLPVAMGVGSTMLFAVPALAADGTTSLSTIVTSDMIKGVFDQVYGLLPTLLPAIVGFIALRKGWSFLKGEIYSA